MSRPPRHCQAAQPRHFCIGSRLRVLRASMLDGYAASIRRGGKFMAASETDWNVALEALKADYGLSDDAIGLLALRLKFRLEDVQTVAAEAITGGGDDKKCDLLYVDKELQIAVIAQCYYSNSNKPKSAAPANKASDLNTAIGWIVSRELSELPSGLRGRADEFRSAIEAGEIKQLYIWYVHNLPSSKNVQDELRTVENTAKVALASYLNGKGINIFTEEIGDREIGKLYTQAERTIIVTDRCLHRRCY